MRTYISLEAPYRWVQVDSKGKAKDVGEVEALDSPMIPTGTGMTIGVVPGGDVTVREVDIPARQRNKVIAAIPYALEESLSADIETLHFALLKWTPGNPAVVGVVAKDKMDHWLQMAADAGLSLDAVVPEFLLLPMHPQSRLTLARDEHGQISIRGVDGTGASVESDLLGYWWQDLEDKSTAIAVSDRNLAQVLIKAGASQVSEWKIGSNFAHWLANHDEPPALDINMMQGDFESEHRAKTSWAMAAAIILFGVAIAFKLGSDAAEYLVLKRSDTALRTEIQDIWSKSFPGSRPVEPSRAQSVMQARIDQMRSGVTGSGDFQQLLSVVSKAIPQSSARVEEVAFRDNELILTTSTSDFAELDKFKKRIEQANDISVELQQSSSRDNRVRGQFKLKRQGV